MFEDICNDLILIADKEIEAIEGALPKDPIQCFVLFTETIRIMDLFSISQNIESKVSDSKMGIQHLDVMKLGWNLAASYLFKDVKVKGFPIMESTDSTRSSAASFLYKLGCTSLLKRSVEMIRSGFLSVEKSGNTFIFRKTDVTDSQFLDQMEFSYLEELEKKINNCSESIYSCLLYTSKRN